MTATAFVSASRAAPSPAALLAGLRADRAVADAAEARILAGAVAWAEAHPARSSDDAAAHWEHGIGVPIAGAGTPLVAEWCIAELAAALGLTTDAGKTLLGHALELRHRLPRVWARVQAGDLQAWRARRIADQTLTLSSAAADYVDRHVAPVAHKIGPAQTQRLVDEAIARVDPDQVVETAEASADRRHVTVHDDQVSFNGTMRVEADLDIADAFDLDSTSSPTNRPRLGRSCFTSTSPTPRSAAPTAVRTVCTSRGWRRATGCCSPTRSATGAADPKPN